jgi:hypothetical protein
MPVAHSGKTVPQRLKPLSLRSLVARVKPVPFVSYIFQQSLKPCPSIGILPGFEICGMSRAFFSSLPFCGATFDSGCVFGGVVLQDF